MNITIFGAGSQGDIQPCIRLGKGLQAAGFDILLAAPQNFASLVGECGVRFHPVRGDVQQIMAGESGQQFMEGGGNFFQSIRAMRKMLGPIIFQMTEDVLAACQPADALITLAVFAPFGKTVAEICGIPLLLVEPTPVLPTRDFPAPGWFVQKDFGGMLNGFSGLAMLRIIWEWYRPFVNEFRERFGLKALNNSAFYRILTATPLLGAYSSAVIPRPHDWPANVHITGYWFDNASAWKPPLALEKFLSSGEAPVYIGFGSMAGHDPEHLTQIALAALVNTGKRGVLATGWGGLKLQEMPQNVFVLDSAPHGWLFPRMAAIVHHGGAGTTAEGLRAGVPTVIVPFTVDQPFWGRRVEALGVGARPIQAKGLSVARLTEAIQRVTSDASMQHKAKALGERIRAEDGTSNAVKVIQSYLGEGK